MDKNRLMKIGALARLTGVPPATIQYYITQGILPRPKKTSRNMAYYDASYIDRIKAVKELQKKLYLPLKVIRKIFRKDGNISTISSVEGLKTLFAVKGESFSSLTFPVTIPPVKQKDLIARTHISPADVKRLETLGMIEPKDGLYDEDDIRIAEIIVRLRSQGFTESLGFSIKDLRFLHKSAERIAKEEVRIFSKNLAEKLLNDDSADLAKKGIDAMNTLFSIFNRKFIKRIISEMS